MQQHAVEVRAPECAQRVVERRLDAAPERAVPDVVCQAHSRHLGHPFPLPRLAATLAPQEMAHRQARSAKEPGGERAATDRPGLLREHQEDRLSRILRHLAVAQIAKADPINQRRVSPHDLGERLLGAAVRISPQQIVVGRRDPRYARCLLVHHVIPPATGVQLNKCPHRAETGQPRQHLLLAYLTHRGGNRGNPPARIGPTRRGLQFDP